jgi:hypothetical protein
MFKKQCDDAWMSAEERPGGEAFQKTVDKQSGLNYRKPRRVE